MEQDVRWGNAKSHIINQDGAGVRDHGDVLWSGNRNALLDLHQQIKTRTRLDHLTVCVSDLRLVLAEVWQGEGRLWINAVMVDVSLWGHKHQLTASAEQKELWICRGHYCWTLSKGNTRTEISSGDTSHLFVPSTILSIHLEKMASNVSVTWAFCSRKIWKPWWIKFLLRFAYGNLYTEIKIKTIQIHQTHLNLFMFGIHKWAQLERKKKPRVFKLAYRNWHRKCDSWIDSNCTSMQTSGWSLVITCIRSNNGSNVRLSEGVYGPHATKIFTGSGITNMIVLLTESQKLVWQLPHDHPAWKENLQIFSTGHILTS